MRSSSSPSSRAEYYPVPTGIMGYAHSLRRRNTSRDWDGEEIQHGGNQVRALGQAMSALSRIRRQYEALRANVEPRKIDAIGLTHNRLSRASDSNARMKAGESITPR